MRNALTHLKAKKLLLPDLDGTLCLDEKLFDGAKRPLCCRV
ncbi:MAG: hypothetical protein PUC24_00300 [Oscillospiraceae bacterium]|nr:hypothetical protein [Oscillospiraceae bacterium]